MEQRDGSAVLDPQAQAANMQAAQARSAVDERFKQYTSDADSLRKAALELNVPAVAEDMTKLLLRLKEGPVRLLVLGTSCAGKSTLVNALAGTIVSPEGDWVTSCVPLWVKGVGPTANKIFYSYRKDQDAKYGLNRMIESRPDVLSKFCHAPHGPDDPKVAGCAGLEARVRGGFLWRTGLTLVDPPGFHAEADESRDGAAAARREEDTRRALDAIDMGAELLVILHRKHADETDTGFLRSLFPGKERDLSLDMDEDVFLIGNNDPKYGTKTAFQAELRTLVSPWESRFYFINVLKQRLQVEYYRYDEWFPGGMSKVDIQKQAAATSVEKNGFDLVQTVRMKLHKGQDYVGQDLTEGVAGAECEQDALEAYNAQIADGESGEEALAAKQQILDKKGLVEQSAVRDWAAMEDLKTDLAERAAELYADPEEKIYQPIEKRLAAAATSLANECLRRMAKIEADRRHTADKIDGNAFYTEKLNILRKEHSDLLSLKVDVLQAKAQCGTLLQKAEESVAILTSDDWIDRVIGKTLIEGYGHTAALQEFDMGGGNETFTRGGTWYQSIVEPCKGKLTEKRREAASALEGKLRQLDTMDEITYTEGGTAKTYDNPVKWIQEVFNLCGGVIGKVKKQAPDLKESLWRPADGWYQSFVSDTMKPVKRNELYSICAMNMADEMSKGLKKRQEGLNRPGFGQRLTNIFLEPNTYMIVNGAMENTLDEAIKGDLRIVAAGALDYWNRSVRSWVTESISVLRRLEKQLNRRIQQKERDIKEEVYRERNEYYKSSVASDKMHIKWKAQRQNWLDLMDQYKTIEESEEETSQIASAN